MNSAPKVQKPTNILADLGRLIKTHVFLKAMLRIAAFLREQIDLPKPRLTNFLRVRVPKNQHFYDKRYPPMGVRTTLRSKGKARQTQREP